MRRRKYTRAQRKAEENLRLSIVRLQNQRTDLYRKYVWAMFQRVVENTPQYSGLAAANWEIGIGEPSSFYYSGAGAFPEDDWRNADPSQIRHKGHRAAVLDAYRRNINKIVQIKPKTRVYITNNAPHLKPLQENWMNVLRAVNRPYEIVEQSAAIIAHEFSVGKRRANFRVES